MDAHAAPPHTHPQPEVSSVGVGRGQTTIGCSCEAFCRGCSLEVPANTFLSERGLQGDSWRETAPPASEVGGLEVTTMRQVHTDHGRRPKSWECDKHLTMHYVKCAQSRRGVRFCGASGHMGSTQERERARARQVQVQTRPHPAGHHLHSRQEKEAAKRAAAAPTPKGDVGTLMRTGREPGAHKAKVASGLNACAWLSLGSDFTTPGKRLCAFGHGVSP